jgi:hypothetical protein
MVKSLGPSNTIWCLAVWLNVFWMVVIWLSRLVCHQVLLKLSLWMFHLIVNKWMKSLIPSRYHTLICFWMSPSSSRHELHPAVQLHPRLTFIIPGTRSYSLNSNSLLSIRGKRKVTELPFSKTNAGWYKSRDWSCWSWDWYLLCTGVRKGKQLKLKPGSK